MATKDYIKNMLTTDDIKDITNKFKDKENKIKKWLQRMI